MLSINWNEFKEYKEHRHNKDDNFIILLDFMKSYYNMYSPADIYEIFREDELALMMLEKREITDAVGLESYLFKLSV
ncbi:hypothetical protein KKG72_02810 [bacterium]|nr:hypothetical protein [bacterium]MBU1994236.1 hypothetical protein [bacterium]